MACVYKRKGSPFWWIKRKGLSGKWERKSTSHRTDNPLETKLARAEASRDTSNELGDVGVDKSHRWDHWVDNFLSAHCRHGLTRKGYLQSWAWLRSYLAEKDITSPAELTYTDVFDYVAWRTKSSAKRNGAKKSTSLRDIKVLRILMRHAVRTGMAAGNPCDRLGIEKPAPKIKAELSDKQIRTIYRHISHERPWMRVAFSICLLTGCRISEANLEWIELDHTRKTLTFRNPKGGEQRAFTTILPAQLEEEIIVAQKLHPLTDLIPPKAASQLFAKFFRKIGLRGISIHCTRVTYISRLARSAVPERLARIAVNHSSEAVHRIYQRLGVEDLGPVRKALKFPKASSSVPPTD
jgi:integrase